MVIYVGGILILLLFGVMLTHKLYNLDLKTETYQFLPAMALIIAVFATMATVALRTTWFHRNPRPLNPTTAEIGQLFMNELQWEQNRTCLNIGCLIFQRI
jgi:NADH-quinone oxidoreductase subunit J